MVSTERRQEVQRPRVEEVVTGVKCFRKID